MNHNSNIRINRSDWLMIESQKLVQFAIQEKNSSYLIYACLEARLALEKLDLDIVLASIPDKDRLELIELSKPKNGIEKQGKKVGVLKEKYQKFIVAVFKLNGMETNYFDFKKSKSLQIELSSFIHSYHFLDDQMTTDSEEMQKVPMLIDQAEIFLRESTFIEGEGHSIKSVELETMPLIDKELLNDWKDNSKMTEDELLEKLKQNNIGH